MCSGELLSRRELPITGCTTRGPMDGALGNTRGHRSHVRLRFATGAVAWAFAGFLFVVVTASRLIFNASIRFTNPGRDFDGRRDNLLPAF
jgi:hypothetical protein